MQYTAWWLRRARGLAGWWVSQAGLGYLKDNCPSGLGQSVGHPSCTPAAQPARCRTMRACVHAIASRYSGVVVARARGLAGWWVSRPAWDAVRTIVPAAWDGRIRTFERPCWRGAGRPPPAHPAYMITLWYAVLWCARRARAGPAWGVCHAAGAHIRGSFGPDFF
jgi:hypothetical protein